MTVIGLLLKYILIVALLIAVFVIGVVAYFIHRVRTIATQFNGSSAGGAKQSGFSGNSSDYSGNSDSYSTNSSDSGNSRRQDSVDDSDNVVEEIYDERNPQVANRKIFSKDEGEYVDFEEV